MSRDTSKILGILGSVIYITISFFFYFSSINVNDNSEYSYSMSLFLQIINLSALFIIFYSASEIIKEYSSVNFINLIYFFIGIKILYLIMPFLRLDITVLVPFYNIMYILIYLILGIVAVKLLKIKNPELNISFFKIFIISNLVILFLINTFNYFYIKNTDALKEGIDLIQKLRILNIIPYFFALLFFIKPYKIKQNNI